MAVKVNTDSFIFGVDYYPQWFVEMDKKGRVEYTYENNKLVGARLKNENESRFTVTTGDTIMFVNNQMIVVNSKAAKKYGLQ